MKEKGRLHACIPVKQPVWADCEQEGKEEQYLLQDADRQMKGVKFALANTLYICYGDGLSRVCLALITVGFLV